MRLEVDFSEGNNLSECELLKKMDHPQKVLRTPDLLDKPLAKEITVEVLSKGQYNTTSLETTYHDGCRTINEELSERENLEAVNPNFQKDVKWRINCQRCVPAYEMRCRGFDVTAKPKDQCEDYISCFPMAVWNGVEIHKTSGTGCKEIKDAMKQWGDGSRAQVVVLWNQSSTGHTFVAEQRNGKTVFIDPQSAEEDVEWYFENVKSDKTYFCRIDNAEPSEYINDCCKKRGL